LITKLKKLWGVASRAIKFDRRLDEIKINQGRILAALNRDAGYPSLDGYSFKVFSQWGEDGIIQFLTEALSVQNRTFIEFGVEDFSESNCRFLLMKDNWRGFVVDGSPKNVQKIKDSYYFWQYDLQAEAAFIDRDNVDGILVRSGFDPEVGILSVDIDGVDYHVLERLGRWKASIIIVEYNPVFGHERPVSVPYDPTFWRGRAHHSNLYYGANLPAFDHLLTARGYAFIGVNQQRSNGFYVRKELLNDRVRAADFGQFRQDSTFRESRNEAGGLTHLAMADRQRLIGDLPVVDVRTGEALKVSDLSRRS
jgi:hypothetical protein